MTKLKHLIITIAAVITLLLLCFFIYYRISVNKANNAPIHNDANWVIKLDGTEIMSHLYTDLLFTSSPDRQLEDSSHFRIVNSFTLPLNVYIFNTHHEPAGFYTSVILQDEKILLNNLKHQNNWEKIDDTFKIYKNKQTQAYLTYNRQHVFIAYNINSDVSIGILKDLSKGKNTQVLKKTAYYKAFADNAVLSATNLHEWIQLDALKDTFSIRGHMHWSKPVNNAVHVNTNPEHKPTVAICAHKATKISFPNILTLDSNTLSFITTFNSDQGINMALELLDTTVTYEETETNFEYSENFDRIQTTQVTVKNIPLMNMVFEDNTNINPFLWNNSPRIANSYFPFFPIYSVPYNAISNFPQDRITKDLSHNECGFKVHINTNELEQLDMVKSIKKYLVPFASLHVEGTVKEGKLQISGNIALDKQNQNAIKTIYQMIK